MKLMFILIAVALTGCSTTRFEKELMSKYPMQSWKSAEHFGMEYNYDRASGWIEPQSGTGKPTEGSEIFLPFSPDVIHSFPGRYFYFRKNNVWHSYRYNNKLDDIEELSKTDYISMFSWGNHTLIVGGVKKDGTLDIITTYTGKVVANFKDANTQNPVSPARHAVFVRMKDGTFKNILATLKPIRDDVWNWNYYPSNFTVSPHKYYFGGEVQNISIGIREVDGLGHTDIFFKGAIKDLTKNEEQAKSQYNEKYLQEGAKDFRLNLGQDAEKRFVIIRDGETTPSQYAELDTEKVRDLIWMRAQKGTPRALGLMVPNEKGEPRIHLLTFTDYYGTQDRELRQGTINYSKVGFKDAIGSYYISEVNFREYSSVVGLFDNGKWDFLNMDGIRDYSKFTGYHIYGYTKTGVDSQAEALKALRSTCASTKMTPQQIAQAKSDYEIKKYRDAMRARESYETAIKQIEYRKKLAEYYASKQASQEFQEALGQISGSLTRGATSNTPKGPSGFDDKYDSTGAGWNRYQKWVEKEANRKARPGQN